jgi:hypothetical protein
MYIDIVDDETCVVKLKGRKAVVHVDLHDCTCGKYLLNGDCEHLDAVIEMIVADSRS